MNNKMKRVFRSDFTFDIAVYLLAAVVLLIIAIPLLFVLAASFSDPDLVLRGKVLLIPKGFTLKAYTMVFENEDIWRGFVNSCFYTAAGTAISLVLTIMAAYPLSRPHLVGRRYIMLLIIFTMYFSGGMIPTFLLIQDLGIYNTVWALLLPAAVSTYNLIVAKTFFENSIPSELYESAKLDGGTSLQILLKIVLPLSKAILAVLTLYYAVAIWNAYFDALIYLRNSDLHPLQIVLRNILLLGQTEQMGTNDVGMAEKVKMAEAIKYSAIIVSSIPMLVIYPFVQKHFVKGVMIGAVKG